MKRRHTDEQIKEMSLYGRMTMARAIRIKCGECMGGPQGSVPRGGVAEDVDNCSSLGCSLWPFRYGRDPWRQPMSEERKAEVRERFMAAMHAKRPEPDFDDDPLFE